MGFREAVRETIAEATEIARNPTDEHKALAAAVVAMAIVDRLAWLNDIPFVVRTTMAVGAGFAALFVVSYLLTGQFVPPDEDDDEEFESEF